MRFLYQVVTTGPTFLYRCRVSHNFQVYNCSIYVGVAIIVCIYCIYIYTLWLFNIAMENGPFIDGLPIKNGDFPWLC